MIGEIRIIHPPTNQLELAGNGIKLRDFVFLYHNKPYAKDRIFLERVCARKVNRAAVGAN
jgi:hypothetical protein